MTPKDLLIKIGSITVAVATLLSASQTVEASVQHSEVAARSVAEPRRSSRAATVAKLVLTQSTTTSVRQTGHSSHSSHSSHASHASHYSHQSGSSGGSGGYDPTPITPPGPPPPSYAPADAPFRDWTTEAGPWSSQKRVRVSAPINDGQTDATKVAELMDAIHSNDIGPVRHMITDDKSLLNATDDNGKTATHMAAEGGRPEILEILIKAGATLNATAKDGSTPIDLVSIVDDKKSMDNKAMQVLIERGANPNGGAGLPPIVRCIGADAEHSKTIRQVVEDLLKRGADTETTDSQNESLLLAAITHNSPNIARLLIDHGANISATNAKGQNSLHLIATYGCTDFNKVADALLKRGLDINKEDGSGNTPLDLAIKSGRTDVADYLRKHNGHE